MHCIIQCCIDFNFSFVLAYDDLSFEFLKSSYKKVSATKLGPLSMRLSFTGTLSVIPFSKRKDTGNKNTVLTKFH